jgi:hypothetical protein
LRFPNTISLSFAIVLAGSGLACAAGQPSDVPPWLQAHVGEGEGQIARVVLERARALYLQKAVRNPCYFAMDATRPNDVAAGRRFYIICEADRSFRAISAGHGGGRDLGGVADFANGRRCAKNFGNAMDSELTAGGSYVTSEMKTSFKGYYRVSGGEEAVFLRPFVQFDGEGEAANARQRAIGGHPAEVLAGICLKKSPDSPYANHEGYVPVGKLVDYAGGRSDGCTSWSPSDARQIISMLKDNPTTVYIYPESHDIDAVARAGRGGIILEPLLLKGDRLSQVLAEGKPRAHPCSICEGSSAAAAADAANLQGALSRRSRLQLRRIELLDAVADRVFFA